MMNFIKYPNGEWWELDKEHMRAYNIRNGHHKISKDVLNNCQCATFKSWHGLYKATGYNPLVDCRLWHTGWISPYGDFYPCEAHELDAEEIYLLLYGEEHAAYGDRLIEKGWKKVTNSLMFDIYMNNGHYDSFYSKEQMLTFQNWFTTYIEDCGVSINDL